MRNILINIIEFIGGAVVVAWFGMIATNTIYTGLAAMCWLAVAVGAWNMVESVKSVIKK